MENTTDMNREEIVGCIQGRFEHLEEKYKKTLDKMASLQGELEEILILLGKVREEARENNVCL